MATVLSLAGLDPTAGAGLVRDAWMIARCGGEPRTVATCLTVQNRHGFARMQPVDHSILRDSLCAVVEHGPIAAVKVGMLPDTATLELVMLWLAEHLPDVTVVVDPVLSATAGGLVVAEDLIAGYRRVLPHISLLTPNVSELRGLAGDAGAEGLLRAGVAAVLVTDGDGAANGGQVVDRLHEPSRVVELPHEWLDRGPVHGTGCALSSAVATFLARGESLQAACEAAVAEVLRLIRAEPGP